jgi:hypothetical protein
MNNFDHDIGLLSTELQSLRIDMARCNAMIGKSEADDLRRLYELFQVGRIAGASRSYINAASAVCRGCDALPL